MRIASSTALCEMNIADIDSQIHLIETEAYGAVLRAFVVQSDVLSWGKEALITELRKELRVSDVEHREILGKISFDESIRSLREWHKANDAPQQTGRSFACFDPNSIVLVSHKKLKTLHVTSSTPRYPLSIQPPPVAISSKILARVRDEQWNCKGVVPSEANIRHDIIPLTQNRQASNLVKMRRSVGVHPSREDLVQPRAGSIKPGSDIIKIRSTDKLLYEVEKICGGCNPDPAQIQKAQLVLREQERALMDAIEKLADVSDSDDSSGERHLKFSAIENHHHITRPQFDSTRVNFNSSDPVSIPCIELPDDEYD